MGFGLDWHTACNLSVDLHYTYNNIKSYIHIKMSFCFKPATSWSEAMVNDISNRHYYSVASMCHMETIFDLVSVQCFPFIRNHTVC